MTTTTTVVLRITDINPTDIIFFELKDPIRYLDSETRFKRSRVWGVKRGGGISLHEKKINNNGYLAVHDNNGDIVYKSKTRFTSGVWFAKMTYDAFVDNIAPEEYFKATPIQLISALPTQ